LLYDDALKHVRDALAAVDRLLETVEDVLPSDHDHRVDSLGEEGSERLAGDSIAFVLEPVDLAEILLQSLEGP
jgi:hypothetical protein